MALVLLSGPRCRRLLAALHARERRKRKDFSQALVIILLLLLAVPFGGSLEDHSGKPGTGQGLPTSNGTSPHLVRALSRQRATVRTANYCCANKG